MLASSIASVDVHDLSPASGPNWPNQVDRKNLWSISIIAIETLAPAVLR